MDMASRWPWMVEREQVDRGMIGVVTEPDGVRRMRLMTDPLPLYKTHLGAALTQYLWEELTGEQGEPRQGADRFISALDFVHVDGGTKIDFVTSEEGDFDEIARPFIEALLRALQRLGEAQPVHRWWAVVGPLGAQINGPQRLTADATVDGMLFKAASATYTAIEEASPPSIGGWQTHVSFPVIVEGTSRGYDWSMVAENAAGTLNSVSALFSLAFDAHWKIRKTPRPSTAADGEHALPLQMVGVDLGGVEAGAYPARREEVTVPPWLAWAWKKLQEDALLAQALSSHHEGMALSEQHPSYALIAFISTIEYLGQRALPLETCDFCNSALHAAKRFREALKPVTTAKERKHLNNLYEKRSRTAHEGVLHGGEQTRGSFPYPRPFGPSPQGFEFRYRELFDLRAASRMVLLHHLQPDSPTGPFQ